MKFPSDSYALLSPFKERIKNRFAFLHGSLFESSGRETGRPEQALTEGLREQIVKIRKKNVAISQFTNLTPHAKAIA